MSHTATNTTSETTTDTTRNVHSLIAGDKVRIHGLKGRADLNGAIATVLDTPEAGKYKVELPSGEKVKVKQQNVSTTLTPPEGLPEDVTTVAADGRVTHRVALPAGGWELTMLEQDGLVLTATLAATDDPTGGAVQQRRIESDVPTVGRCAATAAAATAAAFRLCQQLGKERRRRPHWRLWQCVRPRGGRRGLRHINCCRSLWSRSRFDINDGEVGRLEQQICAARRCDGNAATFVGRADDAGHL